MRNVRTPSARTDWRLGAFLFATKHPRAAAGPLTSSPLPAAYSVTNIPNELIFLTAHPESSSVTRAPHGWPSRAEYQERREPIARLVHQWSRL